MSHSIYRPFAGAALALLALLALDLFKIDPSASAATRPTRLDYTMTTLPNGMQVVLLEDHSTPIVHFEVCITSDRRTNDAPYRLCDLSST